MNRCPHCSGSLYMDDVGPRCISCGRPLNPVEPLPDPRPTRNGRTRDVKPRGITTDGTKPVPVRLPSVVTMRDKKGRAG